jgi:uncharacterized repeat protein (TIGR03803 family)
MANRTKTNILIHRVALIFAILACVCRVSAQSRFTVLYNFRGGSDGASPQMTLVADHSGALYGTTAAGGGGENGTVFKLTPPRQGRIWTETVLHRFAGRNDGADPVAGLVFGKDGALYGTTLSGGNNHCPQGCGIVFKLDQSGNETVLYRFTGTNSDAANPGAGVIFDQNGDLFGTSEQGGDQTFGTVFKLTHTGNVWKESTLHSFHEFKDGYDPHAGLIMDQAGALYGTTMKGGKSLDGVIFQMTQGSSGWNFTTLYMFDPHGNDGIVPLSGLIFDQAGSLYGTTALGGAHNSLDIGTVFKLTPGQNSDILLHSFTGGKDGSEPEAGVVFDRAGALYGTTFAGGDFGQGVVFKLTPQADGSYIESVLHSFTGGGDGGGPLGGLVFGKDGALYGTTSVGGHLNHGVVFRLK